MKKIKLALLTVALAGSSMAMAQDKAAMVKQFLDLQRPGIEALARGLVEQSSAPIAQAGSQYLQTQVPGRKREAAAKAADAELKKYFDEAYPDRARQGRAARAGCPGPDPARQTSPKKNCASCSPGSTRP